MANSPKSTRRSTPRRKGAKQDEDAATRRDEATPAEGADGGATGAEGAEPGQPSDAASAPSGQHDARKGGVETPAEESPPDPDAPPETGDAPPPPEKAGQANKGLGDDPQPFDSGAETDESDPASEQAEAAARSEQSETAPGDSAAAGDVSGQTAESAAPPPPVTPEHRPRPLRQFLALVLGGLLAAAIGFAAAWYMERSGWPFAAQDDLAALRGDLAQNSERIAAMDSQIAELRDSVAANADALDEAREIGAEVGALQGEIETLGAGLDEARDSLRGELDAQGARIGDLAARIDTVERMPIDASEAAEAAVEAYRRELAELREQIDATATRAETAISEAESARAAAQERAEQAERLVEAQQEAAREAQRAARADSTLRLIRDAIEAGAPYSAALDDLDQMGIAPPEPLAAHAETGVPGRVALEEAFPLAARDALGAARRELAEDDALGERVMAFLRTQLGMRSLSPREGDDADAILSRAEAALRAGDLSTALSEIDTLPEVARAHMEDWTDRAAIRQSAEDALRDLAAEIETP